jgi:OOP family OmpA-OmpF porin
MKRVLLSCVVAGSLVASNLPNFEIAPMVGSVTSSSDTNLKSKSTYGASLNSKVAESWMLNVIYARMENRAYKDGINNTDMNMFMLNPEYYIKNDGKLMPYITAGVGFQNVTNEFYSNEDDTIYNYGVGLRYILSPRVHAKFDAKHLITDESSDSFMYSAGLAINFDEPVKEVVELDSDGDGVLDKNDNCPNTPKGVEVDASGCPIDSDGDGVVDYLDKCPDTPAGISVNASGCPIDSDGDGVADYLDKCPDTPAGVSVDADGCPLDSDGDGVLDYLDKCPNTPKGFRVDSDGCKVSFMFKVNFEYNSDVLTESSMSSINEFKTFLNENIGYNAEIEGHTDSKGKDSYNQRLSEKRANAVLNKLIELGIDRNRLTSKGYGESNPIADNSTDEGRAKK